MDKWEKKFTKIVLDNPTDTLNELVVKMQAADMHPREDESLEMNYYYVKKGIRDLHIKRPNHIQRAALIKALVRKVIIEFCDVPKCSEDIVKHLNELKIEKVWNKFLVRQFCVKANCADRLIDPPTTYNNHKKYHPYVVYDGNTPDIIEINGVDYLYKNCITQEMLENVPMGAIKFINWTTEPFINEEEDATNN